MKLSDLDMGELLGEMASAITPALYEGVGPDAQAHEYVERAELHALIMGRIAGVLVHDELSAESIMADIEAAVVRMREQMVARLREGIRPGGGISSTFNKSR